MGSFGSYLHQLRESRRFSKSEMANRFLISIAMLTRLESGESQPTLDLLPPIGDLFGLAIAEIRAFIANENISMDLLFVKAENYYCLRDYSI